MCHHARLVQSWLPVDDQHVIIPEMTVNLLVDRGCVGGETASSNSCPNTLLRRQQLVCNRSSLFDTELGLFEDENGRRKG